MPIAGRYCRVITSLCALTFGASSFAVPVDSGALSVAVPDTSAGIIFNVAPGVAGTNDASAPAGWDINFYAYTSTSLALFRSSTPANSRGGVASGVFYVPLPAGEVVGPSSTFSTTAGASAATNFQATTGRKTLGFRFTTRPTPCCTTATS